MSLFGKLKTDGLEQSEDRLGGFTVLDSDIYTGPIKMAYVTHSKGGAMAVNLELEFGGRSYRETVYVTNKAGENFFYNKDDKTKKVPLPGFTVIDEICLVTTDTPLAEQESEEKIVKVYDYEAKKDVNKSLPVLVNLIGKTVSLGILQELQNKNEKNGDGEYVPTAETRKSNVIAKVFHTETKMTVPEIRAEKTEPAFWDAWLKKNKGQVNDRRELKDGAAGQPGRPPQAANRPAGAPPQAGNAGGAPAPRKSLFGNKAA